MPVDINSIFEKLLHQYIQTLETTLLNKIEKAKDKTYVLNKLLNQVRAIQRTYSRGMQHYQQASNYFIEKYNLGESIDDIFKTLKKEYPEIIHISPILDEKETVEDIPFGDKEEVLLKEFTKSDKKIAHVLVAYLALEEIVKRIPNYQNITTTKRPPTNYSISFTPSSKDNKTEFVQIIYALHEAKLINEGKGEITKIVETLAELMQVDLSKNWQSNHSASIHKANEDYQPPVFEALKQAYIQYSKRLISKKK